MGFKTVYIPKKHKKVEDKLNEMKDHESSSFILECIIKQIG